MAAHARRDRRWSRGGALHRKLGSLRASSTRPCCACPRHLDLLGLAVTLYGLTPRLTGLAWAVFIYSTVLSMFGDMLDLDDTVLATSVFRHIGQHPGDDISWAAVGLLTLVAAIFAAIGAADFRRRDLTAV